MDHLTHVDEIGKHQRRFSLLVYLVDLTQSNYIAAIDPEFGFQMNFWCSTAGSLIAFFKSANTGSDADPATRPVEEFRVCAE